MELYLINFDRRAEMAQLLKNWVAYLLTALPTELSNMLAKETPDMLINMILLSLILKRFISPNGSELKTFQQLKDLMVTAQVKIRVPPDVRKHYLKVWFKFTPPFDLAEELDDL
ncbi:SCAN box domain-containing protein [Nephila pilipes]|uniref:SCAN box domain-containing protein n=1 Tax=Nephila pilipes TaxID=299642 RepID=A0A8X6NWC0_NEPPI|nr:SCAN box domain-containing protein [Nephila pilipes]